jgi:hypothetical protein
VSVPMMSSPIPNASWGHRSAVSTRRGGGYYGYKLDLAVCSRTGLPLAWQTRTARVNESQFAVPLIDALHARGFAPETCALDKGYDLQRVRGPGSSRLSPDHPSPQDPRRSPRRPQRAVLRSRRVAVCGVRFEARRVQMALPDRRVQARKPVDQGEPPSPLGPARDSALAQALQGRASVEREFGRLKNDWALAPLRVRGLERVQLHADLTILAKLACALARSRTLSLAE